MIPAFAFLPPEINSALIASGAGSGPLFMAAAAWDALAAELSGAASSFDTVILDLTGGAWSGPASAAMMAAAAPYIAWLHGVAGHAEITAAQARAAAFAYEMALAATVPLPSVYANRAQLVALIATNFLGQNTPAIAATEVEYLEMWAQDVAAMLGYHVGTTSVAATLPTFSTPPTTLAGSLMGLITAPLANVLSQLLSMLGPLGTSIATEFQSFFAALSPLTTLLTSTPVTTAMSVAQIGMYPATALISPMVALAQTAGQGAPMLAGTANLAVEAPGVAPSAVPMAPPVAGFGVASAGLGQARWVGSISVPPTWQGAMPAPVAGTAISVLGAPIPAVAATSATSGSSSSGSMRAMPMPVKAKDDQGDKTTAAKRRGGPRPAVVSSRPKVVPRSGAK